MGHYASEMMCDSCGKCRCVCPAKPDESLNKWVVDSNFNVMQAHEFDEKYGYTTFMGGRMRDPGVARMLRMGLKHLDTPEEALQHARDRLDTAIISQESRAAALRARRKELFGE